jgi:hypothetical protein
MTTSQFEQVRKQELNYTCSACGADRGCDCSAPAIEKAAAAIAANPRKSGRAIAAEIGVSHTTVQNARKQVANDLPPEPAGRADDSAPEDIRIGRDGKSYPAEKKKKREAEKENAAIVDGGPTGHDGADTDADAPPTPSEAMIEACAREVVAVIRAAAAKLTSVEEVDSLSANITWAMTTFMPELLRSRKEQIEANDATHEDRWIEGDTL